MSRLSASTSSSANSVGVVEVRAQRVALGRVLVQHAAGRAGSATSPGWCAAGAALRLGRVDGRVLALAAVLGHFSCRLGWLVQWLVVGAAGASSRGRCPSR